MRLVLATLFLVSTSLAAQDTPAAPSTFAFKGFELGSPMAQAEERENYKCREPYAAKALGDKLCHLGRGDSETIAGRPAQSVTLYYIDDALGMISVKFDTRDFRAIAEALALKYDKPASTETETLQNAMGAAFESTTMRWTSGDQVMTLTQRSRKLTQGDLTITSLPYMKATDARIAQDAKKRADDL